MSDFLRMLLVFFATVNPAAALLATTSRLEGRTDRMVSAGVGGVVAAAVIAAAALGSEQVLDAIDVEPETFRTSAGIVMAAIGVLAIWRAHNEYDFEPSWRGGVFPIGIPLLAGPATVVAAVSYADDPGAAETVAAGLVIVAATAAAVALVPNRGQPAMNAVARLSGALLVVFAAGLIVSGVRDI